MLGEVGKWVGKWHWPGLLALYLESSKDFVLVLCSYYLSLIYLMIQGIYRPRSHQLTLWHVDSSVTGTSGEWSNDREWLVASGEKFKYNWWRGWCSLLVVVHNSRQESWCPGIMDEKSKRHSNKGGDWCVLVGGVQLLE